jgi:peptidoglycan/xylan/chitin deacetylase (PgdA/CDA1 family)
MSLVMSLRSRGAAGSASRTARVLSRFGATTASMSRRLDRYERITSDHDALPTWPTTACVFERHPDLLRRYADRGIELALHGLVHGDHAALDLRRQRETIARAIEIFERAGVRPLGFRGPYLRYNAATIEALRELGLRYHSSQAVVFPLPASIHAAGPSYDQALALYSAVDAGRIAVRPRLRDGLVDIPVAVPDDEIIGERLHLSEPERVAAWLAILELTYRRGDLFTVQLHPERIPELGDALRATLAEARRRRPHVFIARLADIAEWWLRRERFQLSIDRCADDRYRVHLQADADATLVVRGTEPVGRPPVTTWSGSDPLWARRDCEISSRHAPLVGVSYRTSEDVRAFLSEEGFPIELSDERARYGAYVDAPGPEWAEQDVLDAIDVGPGPLVRVGRWPSGARSALAVTGDIDALTLRDFVVRSFETRETRAKKHGGGIDHERTIA